MPAISGRDDGKLFKYIDNSGQGGVIDYRLSAYDMTPPQEASKVWEKVKSAEYRGEDTLPFTEIREGSDDARNDPAGFGLYSPDIEVPYVYIANISSPEEFSAAKVGGYFSVYNTTDGTIMNCVTVSVNTSGTITGIQLSSGRIVSDSSDSSTNNLQLIWQKDTNYSTSGNFSMLDVIGSPENILQVDELKNGWLGGWVPVITGGESPLTPLPLTRKESTQATTVNLKTTFDEGVTWTVTTDYTLDPVTNEMYPTNAPVAIVEYTAFSKQTKVSSNKPVLGGSVGIGDVFTTEDYRVIKGCAVCESLLGVVCNEDSGDKRYNTLQLLDTTTQEGSYLVPTSGWEPKHVELNTPVTTNSSPAVKALPYQISNDGLLSLGIHANELHYDTSQNNWGDDSLMKITNSGTEVFTDLNGNDMIQTVHELSIPYGYSHNRARVSVQKEGVDL